MKLSMTDFNLSVQGGLLRRNGRPVSIDKLIQEIIKANDDISRSQARTLISEWEAESDEINAPDVNEYIKQAIVDSQILDGLIIAHNSILGQDIPLLYYKEGNSMQFAGSLPLSTKEFCHILRTFKPTEFTELRNLIAPFLRPKLSITLDDESICTVILNATNFYTNENNTIELTAPLKPITLNDAELARVSIQYTYKENPILNPYLQEFLNRVDSPEQLCAILWLMFNGIKTPYVVYLYGSGGEGKSSFISMLAKLVKYTSAIELDGLFKYYHMYGKALLTLTESTDCYLMQHKMIKEITGNSIVSCQEKGKKSFSATIDGLLVVDSNNKLKLIGELYEYRRLRYFEIKTPSVDKRLSFEVYTAELGSTKDDFISYCKQCYDKVGKNNLIEPSEDMIKKTSSLVDSYYIYKYTLAIESMNLYYLANSKISIDSFYKIYDSKVKAKNADKFFLENLKTYMRIHKGIFEKDGWLYGITNSQGNNIIEVFDEPK